MPTRLTAHDLIDLVLDAASWSSWDTAPVYGDISESYAAGLAAATDRLVAASAERYVLAWQLPRPESTSIRAMCDREVIRAFKKKFPYIKPYAPQGISIPELGMDSRPLMAIAGGVSPDVIYVNFRQSDTYIQEGFLYPLDEWINKLPAEERKERILPQVEKVIRRWGPGKASGVDTEKHYWPLPYGNYIKGMVWQKDLFKSVGLAPGGPPKDW